MTPLFQVLLLSLALALTHGKRLCPANSIAQYACGSANFSADSQSALLDFKANVYDPKGVLKSWKLGVPCEKGWAGVCGDVNGSVISISLEGSSLGGNIPIVLGTLGNLVELNLKSNAFTGALPSVLGNLSSLLYLDVSHNKLRDRVPDSIVTTFVIIDAALDYNYFDGTVSDCTPHRTLSLTFNCLTPNFTDNSCYLGTQRSSASCTAFYNAPSPPPPSPKKSPPPPKESPPPLRHSPPPPKKSPPPPKTVPPRLCPASNIAKYACGSHNFSVNSENLLLDFKAKVYDPKGALSSWKRGVSCEGGWKGVCGDITGAVISISLPFSGLVGNIPLSLGQLGSLQELNLKYNSFIGSLPSNLGREPSLRFLDVSHNKLSGIVPVSIVTTTVIFNATLDFNYFYGILSSCSLHRTLSLSYNCLAPNYTDHSCKLGTQRTYDVCEAFYNPPK